jgi:hypothetical protein
MDGAIMVRNRDAGSGFKAASPLIVAGLVKKKNLKESTIRPLLGRLQVSLPPVPPLRRLWVHTLYHLRKRGL